MTTTINHELVRRGFTRRPAGWLVYEVLDGDGRVVFRGDVLEIGEWVERQPAREQDAEP